MKRVAIFAYTTSRGKVGRGTIDFYDQEAFNEFANDGGNLIIRSERGDINLRVNNPSSSLTPEESASSEVDPD